MPDRPAEARPLAKLTFRGESRLTIDFEFALGDIVVDPVTIRAGAATAAWVKAGAMLNKLVEQARGRLDRASYLSLAMDELENRGITLGQDLMGGNDGWTQVQEAFYETRRTLWPVFDRDDVPVVEVETHDSDFPVEILPVFRPPDAAWTTTINNDADLMAIAERFLGFTAVVRRYTPQRRLEPITLPNDPALPVQLFRYREVRTDGSVPTSGRGSGFAREEAFLASLVPELSVDGPWPGDETEEEVRKRVAEALFDARQRLMAPGITHSAAALAHFACHCEVAGDDEADEVQLSTRQGELRSVRKRDIAAGYGKLGRPAGRHDQDRAVVIFNACNTSRIDPLSSSSFQQWFLENRHPAFLGTQAAIPDEIAADFAEQLYGYLLGGYNLGEAVVLARRGLLLTAKNPLGLLYVLYGNDQIAVQVRRPHLLPREDGPDSRRSTLGTAPVR
ncbi:CHAT domain-containing protein [Actinoplanes sp. CA-030573]|uniref:CHAT domain-containing protein n=1 Tax=Actinoplanes sp. CA-030573 TaxID=3239898 RepID=UPI003D8A775C